jgi:hypothetical protein
MCAERFVITFLQSIFADQHQHVARLCSRLPLRKPGMQHGASPA